MEQEPTILKSNGMTVPELAKLELNLISENLGKQFELEQRLNQMRKLSLEFAKRSLINTGRIKGNIYFMSIGKSVPMLDKVAATMKSLSFPAFVIDAVHILHGDFGAFGSNDLIVAASKSGHTKELNTTLEYLRVKEVPLWYMNMAKPDDEVVLSVCREDQCLFLETCDEIDGMNRVPTVSPIVFQLILDAIAVNAAGTQLEMTPADFLLNHPGGDIGKFLRKDLNKE